MNAPLERIGAVFALRRRDAGAFARFKASPLRVELEWYEAVGLGNVCLLRGRAMGGLMRMETLVINALERDAPLFSYDAIAALGSHTVLTEYYDTLLEPAAFDAAPLERVKAGVAALPDHDLGAHWYDGMKLAASFSKKVKKDALPALEAAADAALAAYLDAAADKPALNKEQRARKREKSAAYVDGLFENGGPSTDAFVKAIGAPRARELFTRIVFGVRE